MTLKLCNVYNLFYIRFSIKMEKIEIFYTGDLLSLNLYIEHKHRV